MKHEQLDKKKYHGKIFISLVFKSLVNRNGVLSVKQHMLTGGYTPTTSLCISRRDKCRDYEAVCERERQRRSHALTFTVLFGEIIIFYLHHQRHGAAETHHRMALIPSNCDAASKWHHSLDAHWGFHIF